MSFRTNVCGVCATVPASTCVWSTGGGSDILGAKPRDVYVYISAIHVYPYIYNGVAMVSSGQYKKNVCFPSPDPAHIISFFSDINFSFYFAHVSILHTLELSHIQKTKNIMSSGQY
jgi:hypothetical protein